MTRNGIDISNYTSPLTDEQVQYVRDNFQFVIIGLQSGARARAFQQQLIGMDLEYYLDKPGRDISIPHYRSRVWVDIEVGCYTQINDVDQAIVQLADAEYTPGIYCNKVSLGVLDGDPGTRWAHLPLWYADYRQPDLTTFRPFNGWIKPTIWQYSSNGIHGINCDLNVAYDDVDLVAPAAPKEAPMPEDKTLTPEQVTTIVALVSAGEFVRRGWNPADLLPEDKAAIIALAERMK